MKVSVIIPCFNYGHYLPECLQSLVDQTYPNWEALIVDDGSTDCTPQVGKFWSEKEPRIHYYRIENSGVSKARNFGLSRAKGDFVQFLDADDLLSQEKLETHMEAFRQHPEINLTYTENFYFPDGRPDQLFLDQEFTDRDWMHRFTGSGALALAHLIQNNLAVISSPMLKRELAAQVGGFAEGIAYTEDWRFWINCVFHGAKIQFIQEPKAYTLIRVHPKSVSQNILKMQYGELALRSWIATKLMNHQGLTPKGKHQLKKANDRRRTLLIKHIMYLGPINSLAHLRSMAELIPWWKVGWFYLKTLNRRRKDHFHFQRKSLVPKAKAGN